jgi:hypothetical protein
MLANIARNATDPASAAASKARAAKAFESGSLRAKSSRIRAVSAMERFVCTMFFADQRFRDFGFARDLQENARSPAIVADLQAAGAGLAGTVV